MFEITKRTRPNLLKSLNRFGDEMNSIEKLMDNVFHFYGMPTLAGIDRPLFSPAFDFVEKKDSYVASVELPGLDKEDIDMSINDEDILIVKGEKKYEQKEEGDDYYVSECSYGSFRREIPLPHNIKKEKIDASFNKGILKITLPKEKEEKSTSTKIEIKS